jgi:hypothetical protein
VASLISFDIDLTAHEGVRLNAGLDADQQAAYELLIAAGALPETQGAKR